MALSLGNCYQLLKMAVSDTFSASMFILENWFWQKACHQASRPASHSPPFPTGGAVVSRPGEASPHYRPDREPAANHWKSKHLLLLLSLTCQSKTQFRQSLQKPPHQSATQPCRPKAPTVICLTFRDSATTCVLIHASFQRATPSVRLSTEDSRLS